MAKQNLENLATFGVQRAKINDNFTELYEGKVDKEEGKSLIADTEITRLSTVTNQDLSGKQDNLVSGTNIKTVNGTSILGSGDIVISGGASDPLKQDKLVSGTNIKTVGGQSIVGAGDIPLPTGGVVIEQEKSNSTSKVPSSSLLNNELTSLNNNYGQILGTKDITYTRTIGSIISNTGAVVVRASTFYSSPIFVAKGETISISAAQNNFAPFSTLSAGVYTPLTVETINNPTGNKTYSYTAKASISLVVSGNIYSQPYIESSRVLYLEKYTNPNFDNTYNISALFPTSGVNGTFIYTIELAVLTLTSDLIKQGMEIVFRDSNLTTVRYRFNGTSAGIAPNIWQNLSSWILIKDTNQLYDDFYFGSTNRLANPEFESRDTWNTKNPTKQITEQIVLQDPTNVSYYRIPVTIITNANSYLVAAEMRNSGAGDNGTFGIGFSRKTTSGSFVSSIVMPFDMGGFGSFQDPSFVIDRTGEHGFAGRIYLFVAAFKDNPGNWREATTAQADYIYIFSDDDGVTWSTTPISVKSGWDLTKYKLAIPAPNNGIQLHDKTLVVPSFCHGAGFPSLSLILFKEVGGDWKFSNVPDITYNVIGGQDECTVIETNVRNQIMMFSRNNRDYLNSPTRGEYVHIYDKQADKWIRQESTFEVNRSNQFSITKGLIGGRFVYLKSFTDSNSEVRELYTLWASFDLKTWIRVYRFDASGGYSVVTFHNNRLVVVYEELGTRITFSDITEMIPLIPKAYKYMEKNISVQDRMQMIINNIKGIV